MTFWLTALLVWVAAGARVGRVLVKPATTARVAIVIAVAAVAFAATVAVPEVAVAIDNLLPTGVRSGTLSDALVTAAWLLFVTATSVVASAAWPVVSRRNLRQIAWGIYAGGAMIIAVTLVWSSTFGWGVVCLGAIFIVVTGVRNLDWTSLGRGIGIYTAGTTVVAVLAALQVSRAVTGARPAAPGEPDWGWPVWQAASIAIALGAVWIVIELWVQARVLLRRTAVLHQVLVKRFPEVVAHDQNSSATQLKASDHVANIMDALYLQSGGGLEIEAAGEPPTSVAERAERVAQWVRNPLGEIFIDARWIAPPEGMGSRKWVQAISQAFDTTAPAQPSPAVSPAH